jgi:MATE family multidrug resistance protein
MGAAGEWRAEAATYVRIRALAAPAVLVVRAGHGIFRGHQDTRTPLVVTAALNGANLVLDPILIFAAGWGIAGAAWATVTAQWLGAAAFLWLLLRSRRDRMGIEVARLRLTEIRPFLAAGRDIGIRTLSLLAVFTYATRVAAGIGRPDPTAVAAHQVMFQVWVFMALTVDALAIAAQALIGRSRGEGDAPGAAAIADRLVVVGAVVGVVLAGVLVAAGPWLPGWFTAEPEVAAAIRSVYWFLVAAMPLAAVVFVWDGVFLGLADFGFLAAAMFGAGVVSAGFLALVLPLGWGLAGVWWGLTLLMTLRLLTLGWRRWSRSSPLRTRR